MSTAPRKVMVVTGETSGEQHMAEVVREMGHVAPGRPVSWFGSGGVRMAEAGVEILLDVSRLAAIGPWAALGNLADYLRLYRGLLKRVRQEPPDLAVLVDFPDFNLRLASKLKALRVPVCYFIGPQLWAWRPKRIEQIKRSVDRMLVILPFAETYYRERGVDAVFVGHPSVDSLRAAANEAKKTPLEGRRPRVALMPGSRRKEIELILPIQLEAARELNRQIPADFWVIRAPGTGREELQRHCRALAGKDPSIRLEIRDEPSARLLPRVDCAIIKSGTSTLEAMILGVPFAMVYKMAGVSYSLLKSRVATDTFCLANWVAGERIVPEFVQDGARPKSIADYLVKLLRSPEQMAEVKQNLENASESLGHQRAYAQAARQIADMIEDSL